MNLEDVLDDLCARFIINLPEEERSSFERLGFQVEQAFWFYDDFYRPSYPYLPRLNLRSFGKTLLQRYPPLIAPFGRNFDKLYDEFIAYKLAIPVCGAIILNESLTKCLLVKGWSSKASWGFPKGKIGKDEEAIDCAIREVFEETGFDISHNISLSSNSYIEAVTSATNSQITRLFIVPSVSESTNFSPQTRKEISKIQWHRIDSLPTKYGQDNSFYNVVNFVNKLKNWINTEKTKNHDVDVEKKKKKSKSVNTSKNIIVQKKFKSSVVDNNSNNTSNSTSNSTNSFINYNSINTVPTLATNSVLMRDNPSPIHLFEKLEKLKVSEENSLIPNNQIEKLNRLVKSINTFATSLKFIKFDQKIISDSINKSFQ